MTRHLFSLMLCALFLVTSYSAGAARGAERAVGQMVICAGAQTLVVYIAADGTPTHAPHHCPECALIGLVGAAAQVTDPGTVLAFSPFVVRAVAQPVLVPVPDETLARAPPSLI